MVYYYLPVNALCYDYYITYLIHVTPVHLSLCLQYFNHVVNRNHYWCFHYATATATTAILCFYYCYNIVTVDQFCQASLFSGAAELTIQLLILMFYLWLSLCRINKFGFYFTRKLLRSPILVGHQDYFLASLSGSVGEKITR